MLYLSMFVMGGCGLAYEYTVSKLSSDLLGNSARQWAIIIGVMMFFMGVGADAQKYLRSRSLIDKLILAEIALGVVGGFGPILLLHTYVSSLESYVAVQYLLIATIGLLIGLEIPILTRVNAEAAAVGASARGSAEDGAAADRELRFNLGGILKMDYVGALAGALVWVFVLPRLFSLTTGAFVLGLLNVLAAATALLYFRRRVERPRELVAALGVAVVALWVGLAHADGWTHTAEQGLYRDRIVYAETTPFQHIVLTQSTAGDVALYLNGHLQLHSYDEHIYHESLVHPAMAAAGARRRVLILGGGDGLALREVLRYDDVESVTLVDIDPAITRLAAESPYLVGLNRGSLESARVVIPPGAGVTAGAEAAAPAATHRQAGDPSVAPGRVRVVNLDALVMLERATGSFDVILVDFPDPNALELSKLYSVEAYRLLRSKLSADGVVAVQSTSPARARDAFLCVGRTLRAAGLSAVPYHEYVPSFGDWGWWIASRDDRISEPRLRERLRGITRIPVPTRHVTPDTIAASLVFGREALETERAEINTLARDVIYRYYLDAWRRL